MQVSVLLVDDHPIVRTGLRTLLEQNGTVTVVGEASSGEEAITLSEHLQPNVVLCDMRLGAGIDGVATTLALRMQNPAPAVIILTTFDQDTEVLRAIEAGAAGYLLKDVSQDTIITSILEAAQGRMVLAPEMAQRVIDNIREPLPKLTNRELEVLQFLATGASNREISKKLFVTEATVKTHLVHIFNKLHVSSRTKAVAQAREMGWL